MDSNMNEYHRIWYYVLQGFYVGVSFLAILLYMEWVVVVCTPLFFINMFRHWEYER